MCAVGRPARVGDMTIDSDTAPTVTTTISTDPADLADAPGVEFHRLARSDRAHRWWKPILVGAIAAAIYGVSFLLLNVVLAAAGIGFPGLVDRMDAFMQEPNGMDLGDPFVFTIAMLSLILLIPALLLATRIAGAEPVGLLSSVVGRIRWRWLGRCAAVAVAIYTVAYVASSVMAVARGESLTLALDVPRVAVLLVLTIVLVPLQSAAEEYAFRGYLMQTIGSWLRHPAFAILLPVPLFVVGHDYGVLGMTDVAVFAVVAGWLTWRTGGLEAAMALHVVGNVSVFALAAVGLVDVNATELGILDLVLSLLVTLVFAAVVVRLATRHGIQRCRAVDCVAN